MALTKCPDCDKDVSTSAASCPECGRPMAAFSGKAVQTQRKGGKYEAIGFLLIVAGLATCFASFEVGGLLMCAGFVVFLVGRFM